MNNMLDGLSGPRGQRVGQGAPPHRRLGHHRGRPRPSSIALLLSVPWAALGLAIGLAMAVVNLRFLDAGVAKLNTPVRPTTRCSGAPWARRA